MTFLSSLILIPESKFLQMKVTTITLPTLPVKSTQVWQRQDLESTYCSFRFSTQMAFNALWIDSGGGGKITMSFYVLRLLTLLHSNI